MTLPDDPVAPPHPGRPQLRWDAARGTVIHVLTAGGLNVLVLEAGHNPWPGLDDPDELPLPVHGNDELKYDVRGGLGPSPVLEPRTFRARDDVAATVRDDVNVLPKAVGGAFQHAARKVPRFPPLQRRSQACTIPINPMLLGGRSTAPSTGCWSRGANAPPV
jgi:choline dehydrogenase-like flavoprotein